MSFRLKELLKYNLILASRSPRRQMLLKGLDLDFQIIVKSNDENYPSDMPLEEVPEYLSKIKATAIDLTTRGSNSIVITADTVVILNNEIIEKPKSEEEAFAMLQKLSGKSHTVITGVSLTSIEKQISFSASSKVYFKELNIQDIEYYVNRYQPFDKAGSYGIQEWIGYIAIESIEGSFYNVMGLPTQLLYEKLIEFIKK